MKLNLDLYMTAAYTLIVSGSFKLTAPLESWTNGNTEELATFFDDAHEKTAALLAAQMLAIILEEYGEAEANQFLRWLESRI